MGLVHGAQVSTDGDLCHISKAQLTHGFFQLGVFHFGGFGLLAFVLYRFSSVLNALGHL